MTALFGETEQINGSNNGSHYLQDFTTMPSHASVRNPMGRMHPPHPRPTVSLDPRPVVIPILSSVIGFPIIVFALICALRHRAIKLRRRDQLKKLQAGVRSVTLDLPPREKVSFFSAGSSPEFSLREVGDRLESTRTAFATPSSSMGLKSSLQPPASKRSNPSSKNNNHVKFVTPTTTLDASHTMKVDVVLHTIATAAAESVGAGINGSPWRGENYSPTRTENGIELSSPEADSPR